MFKNLSKPYLIAEIGINHNGDINIAKKLKHCFSAVQKQSRNGGA